MNVGDFRKLWDEFDSMERGLSDTKRGEYANDEDCLINFKEVAQFLGIMPEEYCMTVLAKHIHGINHAIRVVCSGGKYRWAWSDEFGEALKQRFADARNYLMLMAAIIEEKVKED